MNGALLLLLTVVVFAVTQVKWGKFCRFDSGITSVWKRLKDKNFPLTILHSNDVHTHFLSFNEHDQECTESDRKRRRCWGGAASRQTAMKRFAKMDKNVLKLDAGDQFQGTHWYTLLKWGPIAEYMNAMKYDAMTIGNHEFDDGVDVLAEFLRNLTFPVVTSNIEDTGSPLKGLFRTKLIIPIGGENIGIVGCTPANTPDEAVTGKHLIFHNEVTSVRKAVDELVKDRINKIIVLSHGGYAVDQNICETVKNVDIVVGGHTHTFLWPDGEPLPEGETMKPRGPYPHNFTNGEDPCLVVQAWQHGKYLGRLKVVFDETGRLEKWEGKPVLLDVKKFPEDKVIKKLLKPHHDNVEHTRRKVVGRTAVEINQVGRFGTFRIQECELGNLVADAALYYYVSTHFEKMMGAAKQGTPWSNAAIAIWNAGTIRGLQKSIGSNITMGELLEMMPYGNTLERIAVNGSTLKEAFEHAVKNRDQPRPHGRFLHVSGARVVYDLSRPEGQRVKRILVQCDDCPTPRYEPLDHKKKYYVVTLTYLSQGGDGYTMLENGQLEDSDISDVLDIDVVLKYLKVNNPLITGDEMRIEIYNGDEKPEDLGYVTDSNRVPAPFGKTKVSKDDVVKTMPRPNQDKLNEVVGRTAVEINQIGTHRTCHVKECELGNFLADAALFHYVSTHLERMDGAAEAAKAWSPAGIAICNSGAIRDLQKTVGADITMGDLLQVMPSSNKLEKIAVNGATLLAAFEHAVTDWDQADVHGRFLHVSGAKVVYDLSKPEGQRVKRILIRCAECPTPRYEPLDYVKKYYVITHTHLSQGGDGFTMLAHGQLEESEKSDVLDIDAMSKYLKVHNPLKIGDEMRVEVYNGDEDPADIGYVTESNGELPNQ